jgi:hypothetical protein
MTDSEPTKRVYVSWLAGSLAFPESLEVSHFADPDRRTTVKRSDEHPDGARQLIHQDPVQYPARHGSRAAMVIVSISRD